MPKDELLRLLMHLPNGAVALWWCFGWPVPGLTGIEISSPSLALGLSLLTLFIVYQLFQIGKGKPGKDQSWMDVQGICWGVVLAGSLLGIFWRLG